MKFIIGLGNPDDKYKRTYHNIGYMFADEVAKRLNVSFTKNKCKAFFAEGMYNGEKIMIFKPTTYMNLSGECVVEVIKKLGAKIEDIIIAVDDIDLPVGKYRYREKGSAGTHNGLRNIIALTGRQDIKRIRIGIGKDARMPLIDFVLSTVDKETLETIQGTINEAVDFMFDKVIV